MAAPLPPYARTPGRCAARLVILAVIAGACREPAPPPPQVRFLHTFNPDETRLLDRLIGELGLPVDASLVPFARGRQVIGEILRAGSDCPDLVRIDATWLPELVARDLVREAPPALAAHDWTPEAAELARLGARWWSLPQAVDGLVLVRAPDAAAPASPALDDLIAAARAARTTARRYPLSVRLDGYWFVPWLRDAGGELAPGGAGPPAVHAMARIAALFGDVAPPPPSPGLEEPDENQRWTRGEIAYWITGPWNFHLLGARAAIAVSAVAHAPRGGQLLVVPRCARRPDAGWQLADALTSHAALVRFAERFATVPTRTSALAAAPELSRAASEALRGAAMLPRDPVTPLLFDDLNAALAAVAIGDATPDEAVAGLSRGWQRLTRRAAP